MKVEAALGRGAVLLTLALVAAWAQSTAQVPGSGRVQTPVPERTDAGQWHGTWFYANRDVKMVLWLRQEQGRLQLKLRYSDTSSAESFETDWDGHATYRHDGFPGEFAIGLTASDENTIKGSWHWQLDRTRWVRKDTGAFTLYRTGDGRSLAWLFDEFERKITSGGQERELPPEYSWTFRKASTRMALWDEIPF